MDDPSSTPQTTRGQQPKPDGAGADSATRSGEHLFDQALALVQVDTTDHRATYEGQVHPAFKNINDPYGGWTAAILAKAIIDTCEPDLELVSVTTDYLSVPSGVAVQIDVDSRPVGTRNRILAGRLGWSN